MRRLIIVSILILWSHSLFSQSDQYLGLNLNQLPATSIDLNYEVGLLPFVSLSTEAGITFNYQKNVDLIGYLLSSHCDCIDPYEIDKTNGGHLKIGVYLNLRKNFDKANYFNIGLFINQSLLRQQGRINEYHPDFVENGDNDVEQSLYILGFSSFFGYNLKLAKRISTNFGFQVSFASDKVWDIYGNSHFIPGMGLNDFNTVFPMFVINLNYKLK